MIRSLFKAIVLGSFGLGSCASAAMLSSGPYFSGNLGMMDTSASNVQSNNATGYQFALGYQYALAPSWAVLMEAGLFSDQNNLKLNELGGAPTSVQMNLQKSLDLMLGARYLWNSVVFSAKGGMARETVDFAPLDSVYPDKTQLIPAAAIGIDYLFNEHVSLGLQYFRTFGHSADLDSAGSVNGVPSVDLYTLGITLYY